MISSRLAAAAVLFSSLMPVSLFAQPAVMTEREWEGFKPGVSVGGHATYMEPGATDADENKWYGGGQIRFYLPRNLGINMGAEFRRLHFDSTQADNYPVHLSLLYYLLPEYRFTPYVMGGGDWQHNHVVETGEDDERFGGHVGAGLQYFMTPLVSLDVNWRYFWLEKTSLTTVHGQQRRLAGEGQTINTGLNFHF